MLHTRQLSLLLVALAAGSRAAPLAASPAKPPPTIVEFMGQEVDLNPITIIKDTPKQIRTGLSKFKQGMGGIRNNWRDAGAIRKRIKRGGAPPSYQETTLLRRQGEDSMKLLQV